MRYSATRPTSVRTMRVRRKGRGRGPSRGRGHAAAAGPVTRGARTMPRGVETRYAASKVVINCLTNRSNVIYAKNIVTAISS